MRQGSEHEFAEFDASVVALEDERPRLALVGVDGDGGETVDLALVDDLPAVQDDGDGPAHQADMVGLPFAGGFTGVDAGDDAAVEGSV